VDMGNEVVVPSFHDWYTTPLKKSKPKIRITESMESGTFFMVFEGEDSAKSRVVVKAYEYKSSLEKLPPVIRALRDFKYLESRPKLRGIVPFSHYFVQDTMAFLVRPKLDRSLTDIVLYQAPALHRSEKLWLAFQIREAIFALHSAGISHGDIKPNNIFVPNSMQIAITDIAPYKPLSIDPRFPHVFYHYFAACNSSGYYMAPERLFIRESRIDLIAADYFSFGCVLAFIFLDGYDIFNLNSIQKYWENEFDIDSILSPIGIDWLISLIKNLLSRDLVIRHRAFAECVGPNQFIPILRTANSVLYHSNESLDVYKMFPKLADLSAKVGSKSALIFFDYMSDKFVKLRNLHQMAFSIDFLVDFAENLDDYSKASHAIAFLMSAFVVKDQFVIRRSLFGIRSILMRITELPPEFFGLFTYVIPFQCQEFAKDEQLALVLAEVLPFLTVEIDRLTPEGVCGFCSSILA
jgi:serine/threonine protein kinase